MTDDKDESFPAARGNEKARYAKCAYRAFSLKAEELLLLGLGDRGADFLLATLQIGFAAATLFDLIQLLSHFDSLE